MEKILLAARKTLKIYSFFAPKKKTMKSFEDSQNSRKFDISNGNKISFFPDIFAAHLSENEMEIEAR